MAFFFLTPWYWNGTSESSIFAYEREILNREGYKEDKLYPGECMMEAIAALGWPARIILVGKQIKWNEWKKENGS